MTYARQQAFPFIPCDLCGTQENLQRQKIKELVRSLAAQNDTVPGNLFAALRNVKPTHLLDLDLQQAWAEFKEGATSGEDETLRDLEDREDTSPEIVEVGSLSLGSRRV